MLESVALNQLFLTNPFFALFAVRIAYDPAAKHRIGTRPVGGERLSTAKNAKGRLSKNRLRKSGTTKGGGPSMNEDELSHEIIGAAIEVHRHLGPGLLEAAYEQCLAHELSERRVPFELQKPVPVEYKGVKLDCGFRPDFLVGGLVVVEIKSVNELAPVHSAQVLTYLRLTGCKLGLLLNFNEWRMADGIKRIVFNL
jgi:GxxExxY protein